MPLDFRFVGEERTSPNFLPRVKGRRRIGRTDRGAERGKKRSQKALALPSEGASRDRSPRQESSREATSFGRWLGADGRRPPAEGCFEMGAQRVGEAEREWPADRLGDDLLSLAFVAFVAYVPCAACAACATCSHLYGLWYDPLGM